ncbi:DNA glycosylase [Ampelomyces quisqualis]|uniref:DNA-(apurinic or apyrimidinic site) lyase n=1 Tax=Ampelomyces quisqualis TaxID=50730 RepID=A0A6A5Q712_AMPQU|nr:DNA glycosylase [Ampelomyces quisqualis]
MALRAAEWHRLPTSLTELCLDTTLRCGQSFRWRRSADDEWSCTLHGRLLSLKQDAHHLHYRAIYPSHAATPHHDDTLALLTHYLNLAPNLARLYEQWGASDANFQKRAPRFAGVRILRQDAWEALIGFICSSNNNISRISAMVHNLCLHYGALIAHVGDTPYHDFPSPDSLSGPSVEAHLRELGFGYRAKYIAKTAQVVAREKGLKWLQDLSNPECPQFGTPASPAGPLLPGGREGYRAAHEQLLQLSGVGPKVADCVCLFGLGWSEAVPVDTHVWQIAQRDYKFGKGRNSSMTAGIYVAVGDYFRKLWGKEAGWAHSVLFTADLRAFSERLVKKEEVKEQETQVKLEHGEEVVEQVEKKEVVKSKRVKNEPEEEKMLVEVQTEVVRRSKRRKA